jgi:lauroyl/myristoyl acyltransferase
MHFRSIKDVIALPLHWIAGMPDWAGRLMVGAFGAPARMAYFAPRSYVRRTVSDFCRATGRTDPWRVYSKMVGNLEQAALHYSILNRRGRSTLLAQSVIDESLVTQYDRLSHREGGLIFLVPHCAASVLGSAALSTFCPAVLLIREPRSPVRHQLMMRYLQKLGPEIIPSRNVPTTTVMRNIVHSLRDQKVLVGTTDAIGPQSDSVEARAFGQPIYCPAWPAKIGARLDIPIVPGFIHLEGRQIRMLADEGYREADIQKSTQRWVSSFERFFRRYPSDWVFMLDKHWARVFANASRQVDTFAAESVVVGGGMPARH